MWRLAPNLILPLDAPTIVGILNVTPDSFSDGGAFVQPAAAVGFGLRMLEEGAAIIDVGGESTRPGAARVSPDEQVERVQRVVEELSAAGAIVSIDTTHARVAAAALDAGAVIVNDVSGGTEDPAMLPLVAARGCGVILMHRLVPPDRDRYSTQYEVEPDYGGDVVAAVASSLAALRARAVTAGVAMESIVLDPGLGFGKTVTQNFALMRHFPDLAPPGTPLLSAASRKSFLGAVTGEQTPARRDTATIAVSVLHAHAGVRLFRVHDVAGHRAALAVAHAIAGDGSATEGTRRVAGASIGA